MRSRYTAYNKLNLDYITRTMKPPAADHFDAQEALEWARRVKWLRLEVLASQTEKDRGSVEFKAYFTEEGREHCLHERSEFRLENKQWYYFDGKPPGRVAPPQTSAKIQRNAPCPCGSQKKYKKCCGLREG